MTDLDLSRALALAIGWAEQQLEAHENTLFVKVPNIAAPGFTWVAFDYRAWEVAGPIATQYDCFPGLYNGKWSSDGWVTEADSPQMAIALTVIGAKKPSEPIIEAEVSRVTS